MADIMYGCRNTGIKRIVEVHGRIICSVAKAIREGIPNMEIMDEKRVSKICSGIQAAEGGLKRSNLAYESRIKKKGHMTNGVHLTEQIPGVEVIQRTMVAPTGSDVCEEIQTAYGH
jgi:hypothetical protein